jgi:hypothetical protein
MKQSNDEEPLCEKCGNMIDKCECACPYCGEAGECDCCLGFTTTGG